MAAMLMALFRPHCGTLLQTTLWDTGHAIVQRRRGTLWAEGQGGLRPKASLRLSLEGWKGVFLA